MKTQADLPSERSVTSRASAIRVIGAISLASLFAIACAKDVIAPPVSIEPNPLDPPGVSFLTQSQPQLVPVLAVPQSRPYPGTRVTGEGTICKDASSPAGSYSFSIQVVFPHTADLVASTATLSPGQCAIIYNRHSRSYTISPFSRVTITEVIPTGATYRVDSMVVEDDSTGRRTVVGGQSATFIVNAYHGGYVNFFNAALVIPPPPPPPPPPPSAFRFIARVAFTCTNGSIAGSVATNQTTTEVPPGSVTQTLCPITGTTEIGTAAAKHAYQDFLVAFAATEATACGTTLTGSLAGQILAPGVYCFDNAATLTGTLTLSGPATGVWLFKIGQAGIPGGLTGTNFDVVMAGGASPCNVTWWARQASTMNTSNFKGNILAGAGVTFTGGTYKGNASSKEDVAVTGTTVTACDAP